VDYSVFIQFEENLDLQHFKKMKALVCESHLLGRKNQIGGVKSDSKIMKHHPHPKEAVSEEMQMYLNKLKELVPFIPRDKKISKLEIIENVIDYICDLQLALEVHPIRSLAITSPVTVHSSIVSPRCLGYSQRKQNCNTQHRNSVPCTTHCNTPALLQQHSYPTHQVCKETHTSQMEETRPVSC
jgi:hypothetical protein